MKYVKTLPLLIVAILLLSHCKNDILDVKEYDGMWIPQLSAQRGDHSVSLKWYEPQFYLANIIPPNFADPDFTDIYSSQLINSGFEKLMTVKGDITTVRIDELKNGVPIYFYVVLRKRGLDTLISKKIMVIPSEMERTIQFTDGKSHSLGLGSVNNDFSEFAYTNWNFKWNGGSNCCIAAAVLIYSNSLKEITVIDTFSYSPDWHSDDNRLVYITDKNEVAIEGHRPSHLVIYNQNDKNYQHFLDGKNEIRYPVWKNNLESIIYVKNPPNSEFEIWEIDIESDIKTKLVSNNPFADNTLLNPDKPDISSDNKYLFFEAARNTNHGAPLAIWKYTFKNNLLQIAFISNWNDSNPAVSPNGEMLAFISNRSGKENIWIYHFKNRYYKQITGSKQFYTRKGLGKIRWADNENVVFCGQIDNQEGVISVSVN